MNDTRKIITIVPVAFLVYLFGSPDHPSDPVAIPNGRRLIAWGTLFFALIILADFGATSEIAVALAFLVLLSVLLTWGVPAINRASTFGASGGTAAGSGAVPQSAIDQLKAKGNP